MAAELRLLDLDLLDDHPDNPRLFDRQEVIDGVAASLQAAGVFPPNHALHVRPLPGDRYQLLSGYHRKKAALNAGLAQAWAWVEDLDDEQALMALVLANRHGQLSPLEIGLHALKAVPPAQGQEGRGLAAYGKLLSKSQPYLTQLRQAAEVLVGSNFIGQPMKLADRAMHLAQIHSAPADLWPALVEAFLSLSDPEDERDEKPEKWTVARTRQAVLLLRECLKEVPAHWRTFYLRPADVAADVVLQRTRPAAFRNLVRLADFIDRLICENEGALPEGTLAAYHDWLRDNARAESWDMKALQAFRAQIEALIEDPRPAGLADVLLADPPWRYDFSETDSRQIENQYPTMDASDIEAMEAAGDVPAAPDSALFLWATAPKLREALAVMEAWGFEYKTHAVWDKEHIGMGYWFRGQHELLLVGTRGSFPPPPPDLRASSVVRAPRAGHSAKPEAVYELIERMFPEARKHELFLRGEPRQGWTGSGYDAANEPLTERHTA